MGRVVALMDDLFFQMKLAETAKQLGVEVKVAANAEALMGLMASEPKLVIVDLNARSQPIAAIEKLRQTRKDVRVVGFLSHVQTELAAQAQAAGAVRITRATDFQLIVALLTFRAIRDRTKTRRASRVHKPSCYYHRSNDS